MMKKSKIAIMLLITICGMLSLYWNVQSTDHAFSIDDPTAGIMRYRYEESWKWNPNPMQYNLSLAVLFFVFLLFISGLLFEWGNQDSSFKKSKEVKDGNKN